MIFWGDFVARWTEVLSRWEAFVLGQPSNVDSYYHIMKDILPSCLGQDFFGAIQLCFFVQSWCLPSVIRSFDLELCIICVDLGYTWIYMVLFTVFHIKLGSYGTYRWILYHISVQWDTYTQVVHATIVNTSWLYLIPACASCVQLIFRLQLPPLTRPSIASAEAVKWHLMCQAIAGWFEETWFKCLKKVPGKFQATSNLTKRFDLKHVSKTLGWARIKFLEVILLLGFPSISWVSRGIGSAITRPEALKFQLLRSRLGLRRPFVPSLGSYKRSGNTLHSVKTRQQ